MAWLRRVVPNECTAGAAQPRHHPVERLEDGSELVVPIRRQTDTEIAASDPLGRHAQEFEWERGLARAPPRQGERERERGTCEHGESEQMC